MKDPQLYGDQIEQTYHKIHIENMQGIPILNPAINVQALGFHEHEGRVLGIIITPWLMNLVLLPNEDDDWSSMQLGDKRLHQFTNRTYKFMLNEIDGIGYCQTYSLYSPMREFINHDQAVIAAQNFLDGLKVESPVTEEDLVDEDLLGKVMRGEETPELNLDDFDVIEPLQVDLFPKRGQPELNVKIEKKISRSDLLRGNLS